MNRRIAKKHNKQREAGEWELIEIYLSASPAQRYALTALTVGLAENTLCFNYNDIQAGKAFLKAKIKEFETLR